MNRSMSIAFIISIMLASAAQAQTHYDLPSYDPGLQRARQEERLRQKEREAQSSAARATVQIFAREPDGTYSQGSGVIQSVIRRPDGGADIVIYTAAHAIGTERNPIIQIRGTDGVMRTIAATRVWHDPRYDRAAMESPDARAIYDAGVIRVTIPKTEMDPRLLPRPPKFSNDTRSNIGKPIISIGYVDGKLQVKNGLGECDLTGNGGFHGTCATEQGMSGGPVVNNRGEVIGLNSSRKIAAQDIKELLSEDERKAVEKYMKEAGMPTSPPKSNGIQTFPIRNFLKINGFYDNAALMRDYEAEVKARRESP